ncbi:MAG: family 16 glycosylhydrolase, partial [Actinomycetota bacterium]
MHTPSPSLAAPRRRQRLVLLLTAVTLAALVLLGGSLAEAQPGRGGFGSDIADMLGSTAFSRSSAANDGHGAPICVNNSRGGTPWLLVDEDTFDGAEVDRSTWILYDSPGNAGFGLRRPEVITVEDGLLTITAQMIDGRLVSGGMAHTVDQTYGRWEFRVRTDPDPSGATSGVVLTWPQSENWPIDGENDMYETGRDPDRMPFHTYIHYGADNRQEIITHPADGTEWHVMAMEWTADRITMFRDGAYAGQVTRPEVIPDVPHHMTVQLDAWADTMGEPVTMEVDWIRVYTADTDSQCQETTPSTTTSTTTTSSTVAPSTTSTTSTTSTSTTSTTVAPTTTTTTSPTSSSTIAPATSTTVAPTTTSTTVRSTSTAPSITTTTTSTAPSITTTTTSTSSTTAPEPSTTTPSPSTTSTTVAPTTTTTTVAPTEITTPPALNIEPCRVVDGELELNGCVGFLVVPVLFAESSSPDDAEDPDDPIDPAPAANPDDAAEPEAAPENADPDPIDAEDPDSDPVDRREPDAGDDPADNGGPDTDQPVSEEQPDDTEEPGTAVPGDADEPAAEEPGTEDPDQVGEPASADPDAGDSGDAGGEAPASAGSHAVGPGSCSTYRPMAPVGSGVVHTASTQSELNAALGRAKPGDVINLDTGTYTRLHLSGDAGHEAGTSGAPIVIQAARGATPVIENDTTDVRDMKARTVYVAKSQHIVVRGLRVVGGAVGMTVADSDHVVIEHNDVVGSGDAGIAVQSFWDRTGSSNHVRVRCNTISSIGYDQSDAYAEGIYLGHGNAPFDTGSSHIIVSRNEIT